MLVQKQPWRVDFKIRECGRLGAINLTDELINNGAKLLKTNEAATEGIYGRFLSTISSGFGEFRVPGTRR